MKNQRFAEWTRQIKRHIYALTIAYRDERVPKRSKLLLGLVIAYVLSPIDLIPDFIPILGYLDDLVLVPLLVYLAVRMIPKTVWQECVSQADAQSQPLPKSAYGVLIVVLIWVACLLGISFWWLVSRG